MVTTLRACVSALSTVQLNLGGDGSLEDDPRAITNENIDSVPHMVMDDYKSNSQCY